MGWKSRGLPFWQEVEENLWHSFAGISPQKVACKFLGDARFTLQGKLLAVMRAIKQLVIPMLPDMMGVNKEPFPWTLALFGGYPYWISPFLCYKYICFGCLAFQVANLWLFKKTNNSNVFSCYLWGLRFAWKPTDLGDFCVATCFRDPLEFAKKVRKRRASFLRARLGVCRGGYMSPGGARIECKPCPMSRGASDAGAWYGAK